MPTSPKPLACLPTILTVSVEEDIVPLIQVFLLFKKIYSQDGDNPNNGANVLIEDLRQMCILHEISPEAWWGYMQNYDDFCLTDGDMDRCSQQIMLTIGVTADEVNACVQRSFDVYDLKKCTRNKFLEAEEQAMIGDNVYIFPDVVINNFTFRV